MNRNPEIERFYANWRWRKCRSAYAKSKGNLCEKCLGRGIIEPGTKDQPLETHHRIPLTAENITDPKITLNWDNLVLLCDAISEAPKRVLVSLS